MNNEKIGDASAYIPAATRGEKAQYRRVGTAFKDDRGRISIKIDTLPLPSSRWEGWINIFDNTDRPEKPRASDGGPPFKGDDGEPF